MTGAAQVWGVRLDWASHCRVVEAGAGKGPRSGHFWRGSRRGNCAMDTRHVRADVRIATSQTALP
ncbi:hypothetical protein IG631_00936 [Alternaria alternata]|nr:hypothetical protein IG631_00936 [Alternaria alternata]